MPRRGGRSVAEQLTALEVRYEDLRRQYESDMRKMIDLKLQCAEAVSRASDLEEALQKRR